MHFVSKKNLWPKIKTDESAENNAGNDALGKIGKVLFLPVFFVPVLGC